jgi:hypothetical protein
VRELTKIHIPIDSYNALPPSVEACAEVRKDVRDVGSGGQAVRVYARGSIDQGYHNSKVVIHDAPSNQVDDVTHLQAKDDLSLWNDVACYQGMPCHNLRTADGFSQDHVHSARVLHDAFEAHDIVRAAVHPLKGIVRGSQRTLNQEAKRKLIVKILCPLILCRCSCSQDESQYDAGSNDIPADAHVDLLDMLRVLVADHLKTVDKTTLCGLWFGRGRLFQDLG